MKLTEFALGVILGVAGAVLITISLSIPVFNTQSLIPEVGSGSAITNAAIFTIVGISIGLFLLGVGQYYARVGLKKEEVKMMKERVVLCPRCNAENREDAKFCSSCGTPLRKFEES